MDGAGETYGHHRRHAEMALAYALQHIESNGLARLTNYAEFLEKYPPKQEVQILENSSWSCIHGVERWRENCGWNSGITQESAVISFGARVTLAERAGTIL